MKLANKKNYTLPLIFIAVSLFYIFYSSLILFSIVKLNINQTLILSYSFFVFFIFFVLSSKSLKNFNLGSIFFYYLAALSFGFPLGFLFDYDFAYQRLTREKFLYGIYFDKYIALSIVALCSFIFGNVVKLKKVKRKDKRIINIEEKGTNCYYLLGSIFASLYAIYMGGNWLLGNIPTEYLAFKEWSGNVVHNYLKILFWFSTIFVLASANKKQIIKASIIFSIPILILMISGNRNDILYPLLIGIGIYVYRFKSIPKKTVLFVSIFIFLVSPLIAATRSTGVEINSGLTIAELIANSLMELGGQIASVSSMFNWLESGEFYALGGTYVFATLALFAGFINPALREVYFASRFSIESRLPTLAFTTSAEIYYNFTVIGVVIVYFIIGYFVREKESKELNVDSLVKYSFCILMLLHLVRNQFYFSGAYILIFVIIYYGEKYLRKIF